MYEAHMIASQKTKEHVQEDEAYYLNYFNEVLSPFVLKKLAERRNFF